MEKFFYEVPSLSRKQEAIEYINEFKEFDSEIYGVGSLHKYLDDYEGWLKKLDNDYTYVPDEKKVPARTYFFVRESDNKIVGMINIRLTLNERLSKFGGHIGYSIRPMERRKGYNKINLYLGLKVCDHYGIKTVFMDALLKNPASWKTMEALGGERVRKYFDSIGTFHTVVDYNIDVKKALEEHKDMEEHIIEKNNLFD